LEGDLEFVFPELCVFDGDFAVLVLDVFIDGSARKGFAGIGEEGLVAPVGADGFVRIAFGGDLLGGAIDTILDVILSGLAGADRASDGEPIRLPIEDADAVLTADLG